MELRCVDPRTLKTNPGNPRKIEPGQMSDAALAASIKAVGILQPPTVIEKDGELTISYGARRVRAAIAVNLRTIDVLVRDPDAADDMRTLSENVVRAPMATVDLWRAIESLAAENWTEDAIGAALSIPLRQVKKLRLLANVQPALLDRIGAGDMPDEKSLRAIASAPRDDQAAVWKKFKPKKNENVLWWQIGEALRKHRYHARDAKFGEDECAAFSIVWQEDLFAEGDEDNRFTTDAEAFFAAQRAWLDAHMPKNGVLLELGNYGMPKLPPRACRSYGKAKKGDSIGFLIRAHDGAIEEIPFHIAEPESKPGKGRNDAAGEADAPLPKRTRPEITYKGTEIIGALRTEALVKSLEVNPCDDTTLIGLLVLALNARNVSIQTTGREGSSTRTGLVQSITEGGKLSHDAERLRVAARQTLASVLSCSLGHGYSGLGAQIAGDALGADAHLPGMGNEEFLSCLSKAGIEKAAASLNVLPRPRMKDTRAEVIKRAAGSTYVHPAAHFALTEAERAHYLEPPRSYSWEADEADEGDEGAESTNPMGESVDGEPEESDRDPASPDDEDAGLSEANEAGDEPDEEEAPEPAPGRSRARRARQRASAEA